MCLEANAQVQSDRSPSATESLFSCVAKRKVTKREGHPAYALSGLPARKVRGRVTGFVDSTSCADAKLAGILAGHPAGFSSTRPPLQRGPGRTAGHPGPHFSEVPDQQHSNSRAPLRSCRCLQLHHRVRATMARRSTRGPLRGGEAGSTGRAAGIDRDVDAFSPAHGCAVEKPGPGSRTCRAGCPASAKRGVVFSWLLLFWTSKREVTRPPQEDESSSLLLQ